MFLSKESINPRILCNALACVFILGFLGNVICIVVFLRRRFRSRSISVYFIALFFNDCILLFISHVAKMLIFDASGSCSFNIYLSIFIDITYYREMIYRQSLSVLTYNTTYTQISMLIFMFMSIQRVRTFSSMSYRESRMCALMLTLIAFVYGILVSYVQLYDAFCIRELQLTKNQSLQIDSLMNETANAMNNRCSAAHLLDGNDDSADFSTSTTTFSTLISTRHSFDQGNPSLSPMNINDSAEISSKSMCYSDADWSRIRPRTIAYVYLQQYMSIDWPDEHAQRSTCHLENILPPSLHTAIQNFTWPLLQSRPGLDYFHEHQFCTQAYHFIGSYANCSFPLKAEHFQKWYKFLYDRRLSLKNRYTIGFIMGTFIPSCICVISSFICLYYISNRPSIRKHSHSRAELRSLSLILVEILLSLMSALQSYVINFFTCHHLLFRMETDNCYGQSSVNILPNFLGSILELFTSTSNILILMICGAQFRNELIEILHLTRFFPKKTDLQRKRHQQICRQDQQDDNRQHSKKTPPGRMTLSLPSTQNGKRKSSHNKTNNNNHLSCDPSLDSLLVSSQQKEERSSTEVEQTSDETNQFLIKSTTV